jgi:hypothetical protein
VIAAKILADLLWPGCLQTVQPGISASRAPEVIALDAPLIHPPIQLSTLLVYDVDALGNDSGSDLDLCSLVQLEVLALARDNANVWCIQGTG